MFSSDYDAILYEQMRHFWGSHPGKVHQIPSALQVGQKSGMQTMDMALIDLANRGVISHEEAQIKSMTPDLFSQNMPGAMQNNTNQSSSANRQKMKRAA